jgi:predicted DNA-binding transcriptional regulator AlpA
MRYNQTEAEVNPRWIRIPDAVRVSGICRSSIYELINSGAVKSFSHKKEGKTLGQRLISYQSLIDYLDAAYEASKKEVQE